jgi:C-terminal processing protease CtpA/Prc
MSADALTSPAPQATPTERLAGLGRLWGAIKHFHPYLAYRDVDWDEALIETIPRVEAAVTAEEYREAVAAMLACLGDPATRVLPTPEPVVASSPSSREEEASRSDDDPASSPAQTEPFRMADDVAVVAMTDYGAFQAPDEVERFRAALPGLAGARAIVFDLRRLVDGAGWGVESAIQWAIAALLTRPLRTAGSRHRMHSGHRQQRGPTHGGYYSAFVQEEGRVVESTGTGPDKPLAFVLNAGSCSEHVTGSGSLHHLLGGLQAADLATVVHEGEETEVGIAAYELALPDGLRVRMRLSEFLYPDGSIDFRPDVVVPASSASPGCGPAVEAAIAAVRGERSPWQRRSAAASPAAQPERRYPEMTAPSPAYRLLALFRFWNAIHYFFPYHHLLDRSWDEVLPEFVPHFAREGDGLDYELTVARLVARIQDTHGIVRGDALDAYLGKGEPPVHVRTVEGETVVVHLFEEVVDLRVGDVVLAIDGEDVSARRERLGEIFAASTPQALRWRVDGLLLTGAEGSDVLLTVRDADGTVRDVTLRRTRMPDPDPPRTLPVFGVLPEGFGYVDLARLTVPQVDEAFEAVGETPALIFDMRGYPNGTAWSIGPRLTEREVVTARFTVPELHSPDPNQRSTLRFHQTTDPSPKGRYPGQVVVLIDEGAISQSEHTCLFLEAAAGATFVGSPTNGANGNVTNVVLPGGMVAWFTGMEVLHADGRQLQRLGIQPHLHVEPTIAGIRAGRDEVLEAAVAFLATQTSDLARSRPR